MPTTNVAVHTISFRGLAGGIFVLLSLSTVLYVIGFATTAWSIDRTTHVGLWEVCTCGIQGRNADWFRAVQAMITIGLIGLLVSFILACLYMCVHTISKNSTIIALVVVAFVSVLFMLVGFIVYAANATHLSWSFAVTIVASILCLVAGILAIVQMRQSGVRV